MIGREIYNQHLVLGENDRQVVANKQFAQKGQITDHMKTNTDGGKPFKCLTFFEKSSYPIINSKFCDKRCIEEHSSFVATCIKMRVNTCSSFV